MDETPQRLSGARLRCATPATQAEGIAAKGADGLSRQAKTERTPLRRTPARGANQKDGERREVLQALDKRAEAQLGRPVALHCQSLRMLAAKPNHSKPLPHPVTSRTGA